MPCSRIQRWRARATSARSVPPRAGFFESDVVTLEEAPHRAAAARIVPVHRQNRLVQGQVSPSRNQTQQKICMLLQRRDAPRRGLAVQRPVDGSRSSSTAAVRSNAMFTLPHRALPPPLRIKRQHKILTDSSDSTTSWIGSQTTAATIPTSCAPVDPQDRGRFIPAMGTVGLVRAAEPTTRRRVKS
jgi:hypothetical protein